MCVCVCGSVYCSEKSSAHVSVSDCSNGIFFFNLKNCFFSYINKFNMLDLAKWDREKIDTSKKKTIYVRGLMNTYLKAKLGRH